MAAVPVHSFYLVVEGRVLERTEFVKDLGQNRVMVDMSRMFAARGAGRPKATAFVAAQHVLIVPLPPGPVLSNGRPARTPSREGSWKCGKWVSN